MRLLLQRVVRDLGEAVYQLNLCLVPLLSSYCGSMEGDYRLQVLDLSELFLVKVSGADGSLGVAHVGERSVFSFLKSFSISLSQQGAPLPLTWWTLCTGSACFFLWWMKELLSGPVQLVICIRFSV